MTALRKIKPSFTLAVGATRQAILRELHAGSVKPPRFS